MVKQLGGLTGCVGEAVTEGTIAQGTVIAIESGTASEYMDADQCAKRQTPPETPFIFVQIGIEDHGVVTDLTFRDYSGEDGKAVISPNTMHGKVLSTYPKIKVDGKVNMIATKREKAGNTMMIWKLVTV